MQRAILLGENSRIPVHTQIRVAHNVAGAILETVKERHIDLVLMGWKGSTSIPGRVFSRVVDTISLFPSSQGTMSTTGYAYA